MCILGLLYNIFCRYFVGESKETDIYDADLSCFLMSIRVPTPQAPVSVNPLY